MSALTLNISKPKALCVIFAVHYDCLEDGESGWLHYATQAEAVKDARLAIKQRQDIIGDSDRGYQSKIEIERLEISGGKGLRSAICACLNGRGFVQNREIVATIQTGL